MIAFRNRRDGWSFGAVLGAAVAVLGAGTGGFMWFESWDALDALYMTVITLSTVGFGEVQPLSEGGRLFTVCLILGGVACLGFAIGALGERIIEAPKRRLKRRIRRMKDHIIVCGYGRIALPVVRGLSDRKMPFCVIEMSPAKVKEATEAGILAFEGDASLEENLERAGIRQAAVVAALLPHDGANLSIAMTATALRPGIRVIARTEEERSRANFERAGARADDVVSPHTAAGRAVLRSLCSPGTARLFHGISEMTRRGLDAGQIVVSAESGFAGMTLAETAIGRGRNLIVIAVQRGEEMMLAPRGNEKVQVDDILHLLGHTDDLKAVGVPVGP